MKNLNFLDLETERLFLKKIQQKDQLNIYKGLSHPEVIKYYGVNFNSFEHTNEQMTWYENLEKSGSGKWWAIWIKETEEFCGAVGFNDLVEQHKKAEVGFWLLPTYWGKGIIPEAANKMNYYLFNEMKIHRLEAYVEAGNQNSAKTLDKLGFKLEGRLRDSEIKNGKYISVDLYSRLARDK